jgi:SAM-dependent methyltransferase
MTDRYWFDNSLSDEGTRLQLLEKIADPRSISLLNGLGVRLGSKCAELGAGGGSMAAWLADRVGDLGSVLAVDRDLSLCRRLSERGNVRLLEGNLESLRLEPASYDLVHTRNVLMHVDDADRIIAEIVRSLRPGGRLLLEEADYYSLAGVTSEALARVVAPLVARWTWARTMPLTLSRLPVVDIQVMIDASMLHGASDEAAFWAHTIWSARDRIMGAAEGIPEARAVTEDEIGRVLTLLADPTFWTPFASVICVSAQLPEL